MVIVELSEAYGDLGVGLNVIQILADDWHTGEWGGWGERVRTQYSEQRKEF